VLTSLAVATRRLRIGGYAVAVEIPDGAARAIRRVVPRRRQPPAEDGQSKGAVHLVDPPALQLEPRDPSRALDFFRLPPGQEPHAWAPRLKPSPRADPALAAEVAKLSWYHTIELPDGTTTPGYADTRPARRYVEWPVELVGGRCLDVGTFDGFWAFEMERRGAAEVVALDVDDPEAFDWPYDYRRSGPVSYNHLTLPTIYTV